MARCRDLCYCLHYNLEWPVTGLQLLARNVWRYRAHGCLSGLLSLLVRGGCKTEVQSWDQMQAPMPGGQHWSLQYKQLVAGRQCCCKVRPAQAAAEVQLPESQYKDNEGCSLDYVIVSGGIKQGTIPKFYLQKVLTFYSTKFSLYCCDAKRAPIPPADCRCGQ